MKRNRGLISNRVLAGLTILSACLLFPAGGLQTTVSAQEWGTTTITQNIALGGATNIDGDLIVQANLNLNGQVMTVTGDVLLESDVDLAGGNLKIEGSLHQVDSSLVVNNGTLQVRGNYSIEGKEPDENGEMPVSYGWIKMENEADTIIVAGDFSARSYNSSVMSAGTMEFQGNVTDHYGNTIRGSGEHLAVFSGTGNQVVDLQSSSACFQSIRTINTDVTFRQMGFCILTEDIELTGDVEDIWNKLDLNGHTLTINGNVNRLSADLNLNGGHLAVSGNFHHFDPSIVFNQGTLEVGGNYILEAEDTDEDGTPEPSYGWLKMENEADRFIVRGDFSARSYNSSVMSAGTMEFQGNVTDHYGNTIRGSGEHLAVFSGAGNQVVDLQSSSACFQSIRTGNTDVTFRQMGFCTLTEDIELTGDVEDIWNKMDLNGHTLTINGNVNRLSADLNLNGGHLAVSGNLHHFDPNIVFNQGTLEVGGNYILEAEDTDEDGTPEPSYGWLKMENEADRFIVRGDFSARSYNSSVMSAGTIEFQGNVTDHYGNTIRGSGEHLAVFSGKDPQVVEFEHESSSFQSIRTVNEAVHFKTLGVNQLTEDVRISGPVEKIWNKLDLNGFTLQIDGSVDAVMSDINLNRGLLYVSGNFRQLDPNITFNGGTLRIDGTYYLAGVEEDENGEPGRVYGWLKMEAPEDHMIVFGDFVANSYNSSVMSGGIVEIGGKIYDYAGNTLRLTGNGSNDTTVVSGIELDTENTAQG